MMKARKVQGLKKGTVPAFAPAELLDVAAAAKWLGVSRTTLFTLMQEEGFPVIRLKERIVRFDPNSLYEWVLTRQDRIA
jgi:predicted DNA-binding transcriptional regulator AlpA